MKGSDNQFYISRCLCQTAAKVTYGTEQSDLATGEWRQARKEVDVAYKACVKRLNSIADMEGVEAIAVLIQCVNERIEYQKQVLAARKSRREAKVVEESK